MPTARNDSRSAHSERGIEWHLAPDHDRPVPRVIAYGAPLRRGCIPGTWFPE